MATMCGIDEAGRGPIIGPMILCGVLIEEGDEKELLKLKVKDSKLLTPTQRERIAAELVKMYKYKLLHVSTKQIDAALNSDSLNLNWLEAEKAAEIINSLKPDRVVIDCPSPNIEAFTEFLAAKINKKTDLVCAHHADVDYPAVAAASIIAKVTRDREIAKLKKKLGYNFGSGYVADPRTKRFMDRYWSTYPELFRHTWAPYKKLIAGKKQSKIGEF